jgi:hypothetical protein
MCRMNVNRFWVYIYQVGSEVLRAFVIWPPGLWAVTGEERSSSITDLNTRKTDKGHNLFIGIVEKRMQGKFKKKYFRLN